MALVLKDRVRVTSSTTGTGTFTLGSAAAGFQDFSVIGDGNTTYYTIQNSGDNTWEVGIGTYTASGTTLSRDTVLESSNAGSLVNFAAGTKDVFVTYPAEKGLYLDASNNAIGLGTPASATLTNATGLPLSTGVTGTLPVANGGTNLTTYTQGDIVYASATNTLGKLADVATGNALLSGGVGADPVWGKVGLTTHVSGTLPVANGGTGVTTSTGTGNVVLSTSPTLTTPLLGTPTSGTLTNCTGLPISTGVSGLGTGIATFLGTPSSSNLASAVTDETGSGSLVFATSPTLVTPALGTPSSGTLTSCTGLPLTTGVTGTLPVTNGGTGTATSFTTGSVVFAGASGVYSQDNANLFWDDTNNRLGIGTTSPANRFEVNGDGARSTVRTSTSAGQGFIEVQTNDYWSSSTFTGTSIRQRGSTATGTTAGLSNANLGELIFQNGSAGLIYTNGSTPLIFGTVSVERMRIDSSGNVGIGTTSPSSFAKLAVVGDANGTSLYLTDATQSTLRIKHEATNLLTYETAGTAVQRWVLNSSEAMRILSSGNVGIGTSSPAAKLDIGSGNLNFSSTGQRITGDMSSTPLTNRLSFQSSTTNGNTAVTTIPNGTSTTSSFRANNNSDPDNCGWAALTSASTDARITAGVQGTGTYLPITFYTNAAERMRIHASGGVSIGNTTDSGAASLNVSGSMSGGYIAHAAGTTAMAFGADNVVRVTPNATATYTSTVPAAGAICVLSILTSGTTSYTITFGTGFKSTGTLATGTVSERYFNITFVSDGTNLIETSRTVAIA